MVTTYYNNKSLRVADSNYDDIQGDVRTAATGASQWLTAQIGNTGFLINWLQAGQNDYYQQSLQMYHRKEQGSALADLHIHYTLSSNPSAGNTIKLEYAYTWVNIHDVIPQIESWTTDTHTITFDGTELAQQHYLESMLENIPAPANETYSSLFFFKVLRRSQGVSADTYAGNFGLLSLDGHIKIDRLGSILPRADS